MQCKYFLVHNQQEWKWLMQKFENENSATKWVAGEKPSDFKPWAHLQRIGNGIVVKLKDSKKITYQTRDYFMDWGKVSSGLLIEVNKLMEGEYHG